MKPLCNGKKIYHSERAAKLMRNIRGKAVEQLRVYACQYCHGWHLTTMTRDDSDTWRHHG
jgi:hypothetical protein